MKSQHLIEEQLRALHPAVLEAFRNAAVVHDGTSRRPPANRGSSRFETVSAGEYAKITRPMTAEELADHVAGYPVSRHRKRQAWARERAAASNVVPLRRCAASAGIEDAEGAARHERRAA